MPREFYGATIEAQNTINRLLSLSASGQEQDWEFELAEPDRIGEMLQVASSVKLTYDEKCALALLTIASLEAKIAFKEVPSNNYALVKAALKKDPDVLAAMIFYWIDQKRAEDENYMRELLID